MSPCSPPTRAARGVRFWPAIALALLAGCRHEMYDQPRYDPLEPSDFFNDGKAARPLVTGTVARGEARNDLHLYEGQVDGKDAERLPPSLPLTRDLLARGQQRYRIFCTPCHGELGDGRGMVVQRGFTPPPSFYGRREPKGPTGPVPTYEDLREAPLGHFYRVMTYGHGAMYSYAQRIPPKDRWAIAAYIRALQLSQHATIDDLKGIADPTDDERRLIREAAR